MDRGYRSNPGSVSERIRGSRPDVTPYAPLERISLDEVLEHLSEEAANYLLALSDISVGKVTEVSSAGSYAEGNTSEVILRNKVTGVTGTVSVSFGAMTVPRGHDALLLAEAPLVDTTGRAAFRSEYWGKQPPRPTPAPRENLPVQRRGSVLGQRILGWLYCLLN
jgi:hypothetical protein